MPWFSLPQSESFFLLHKMLLYTTNMFQVIQGGREKNWRQMSKSGTPQKCECILIRVHHLGYYKATITNFNFCFRKFHQIKEEVIEI